MCYLFCYSAFANNKEHTMSRNRKTHKDHSHVYIDGTLQFGKTYRKASPSGVVYICNGIQSVWYVPGTWYEDEFSSYWN